MMRALVLAAAILVAGCAHTETRVAIGATAPGGGVSAGVRLQAGSAGAALVAIGILAGAAWAESSQDGMRHGASALGALGAEPGRTVPPLDAARRIHEQDCTQPIADAVANLRCR